MPRRKTATQSTSQASATVPASVPTVSVEQSGPTARITLALGSIFERYDPSLVGAPRYNSEVKAIYERKTLPTEFRDRAKLCRFYYEHEPIVGSVIDIMTEFTFRDIVHRIKDKKIKQIFDAIYETSNLQSAIRWALLDYYVVGNSFPYRYRTDRTAQASNGVEVPVYQWTVLNPDYIDVQLSPFTTETAILLEPTSELQQFIDTATGDPSLKRLLQQFPRRWLDDIKGGKKVLLNTDQVYHLARKRQPYQRFATPFVWRAIRALMEKEKLAQVDMAIADGIIQQMIVFKLGSDEYPATQEEINKFSALLQTRSKAFTIVWNHALEVEFHRPDASWFDPRKYDRVDRDIRDAMGIATVLIQGQGSNYAQAWVSLKGLMQRLQWARDDLEMWLAREYTMIAKDMNLPSAAIPKLRPVNVEEERTVKQILVQLRDRGVLSAETLLNETGFEADVERARLEQEKQDQSRGIFVPLSPYQQSPGRPPGVPNSARVEPAAPETNSNKASIRLAQRMDDRVSQQYRTRLEQLVNRLRSSVAWVFSFYRDPDKRRDEVIALLAMLEADMNFDARRYMEDTFERAYRSNLREFVTVVPEQIVALREETVNWNAEYVRRFVQDIQNYLMPFVPLPGDVPKDEFDRVFNIIGERIQNFVNDGLYVAQFRGVAKAMESNGMTRGRWLTLGPNPCSRCLANSGRDFSIDELLSIYPPHNHCHCAIEFYSPEENAIVRGVRD